LAAPIKRCIHSYRLKTAVQAATVSRFLLPRTASISLPLPSDRPWAVEPLPLQTICSLQYLLRRSSPPLHCLNQPRVPIVDNEKCSSRCWARAHGLAVKAARQEKRCSGIRTRKVCDSRTWRPCAECQKLHSTESVTFRSRSPATRRDLTASGIPLGAAFRSWGCRQRAQHVALRNRAGYGKDTFVESFLILNAAGGSAWMIWHTAQRCGLAELVGHELPSRKRPRF